MNSLTTRRELIQKSVAAAALAALPELWGRPAASQEPGFEIGRGIKKSLKWNMIQTGGSTLDQFRLLKELGYDGVEIDSPGGVDKDEAIAASRETGLPIEGVVNATHWRVRHSDPDPEVRAEALANMKTALRDARRIGADSVLLVPGKVSDPERENHDQVWQRSADEIRKLIPLAELLEIKILIENVGNGFCETPELLARYVDQFESPWVAIHFDIGNHIWAGPPAEWIRVLGKRIKKLDVKDRTRDRQRTKIGEGDADWPAVREALLSIGYQGWAAAEVPGGDRQRLKEILQRMNAVLGKSAG